MVAAQPRCRPPPSPAIRSLPPGPSGRTARVPSWSGCTSAPARSRPAMAPVPAGSRSMRAVSLVTARLSSSTPKSVQAGLSPSSSAATRAGPAKSPLGLRQATTSSATSLLPFTRPTTLSGMLSVLSWSLQAPALLCLILHTRRPSPDTLPSPTPTSR